MHGWQIEKTPSSDYVHWCHQGGYLFASPEWAQLMRTLGATPVFAWSHAHQRGTLLPVFRLAGVAIGILGLPVAGDPWDALDPEDFRNLAGELAQATGVCMMRANHSRRVDWASSADSARPEVWIDDLGAWSPKREKRLRKDLNFAHRKAKTTVEISAQGGNAREYFSLYASTLRSHKCRLRYTPDYFEMLLRTARASDQLDALSAIDSDSGDLRGFAVLAIHGAVGYYIHGAVDASGKRQGLTDLLLEALVERAAAAGCHQLSLMASPWDQPGLIRFKSKWGNQQGLSVTHDVPNGWLGRAVTCASRWRTREARQQAMAWARR